MLLRVLAAMAVLSLVGCSDEPANPYVTNAVITESVEGRPVIGGYFDIHNPSGQNVTLSGVHATEDAIKVMMHESYKNAEGLMMMRPIDQVVVQSGEHVHFESGSYHLMLTGVPVGTQKLPLNVCFDGQNCKLITFKVRS